MWSLIWQVTLVFVLRGIIFRHFVKGYLWKMRVTVNVAGYRFLISLHANVCDVLWSVKLITQNTPSLSWLNKQWLAIVMWENKYRCLMKGNGPFVLDSPQSKKRGYSHPNLNLFQPHANVSLSFKENKCNSIMFDLGIYLYCAMRWIHIHFPQTVEFRVVAPSGGNSSFKKGNIRAIPQ